MTKLHMRLGLAGGVIGLVIVGALTIQHKLVTASYNQAVFVGTTSDRAREFIANDAKLGTGLWSEVSLNKLASASGDTPGQSYSTACFTTTIPFTITNPLFENNPDGHCVIRARVVTPSSYLVVSTQNVEHPADNTGVTMRRQQPKLYQEHQLTAPSHFDKVVYFTSDNELVLFAWDEQTLVTLALTNLNHPEVITADTLQEFLSSYQATQQPPALIP